LNIRGEYNHIGKQYFDFANNIVQKGYGLVNFRISYRTEHIDISFWGRNLSGVKYIDYAYDFGAAHLGDPRTIGIGVGYRF
jgi:iron complex outermembrane receptor protein